MKLTSLKERNENLLKEFKRKSFEVLRAFRNLIGFKVKLDNKIVKLICETNTNNYLSFRVIYIFIL